MSDRLLPALLWLLAVAFTAAIVHLGAVLAAPRFAARDAFARLAALAPAGLPTTLPAADDPRSPFPGRDPAVTSAVCRYDLGTGPLRVVAQVVDGAFTAVSFHTRFGRSFYALTETSAVDGRIEMRLMTKAQRSAIEATDEDGEPVRDVRVTAPEPEGFVEFDVVPRVGGKATAERALRSMRCEVERAS